MSGLDWQTEDEDGWEQQPQTQSPQRRINRWLLTGLVVLLAVGLTAVFLVQQLRQQVDDSLTAVESEVLRSFELVYTSSANRDRELFTALLSGRDTDWAEPLYDHVEAVGLLDRSAFGLTLQNDIPTVEKVVMSPNLTAAEVWSSAQYTYLDDSGVTQSVTLYLPHIYRQGRDRWLYSPPTTNYWGDLVNPDSVPSDLAIDSVRDRDLELATRVVADINLLLDDYCEAAADAEHCDVDRSRPLVFSTRPSSFVYPQSIDNPNRPQTFIMLPTPSIFGLPLTEEDYPALLHAYWRVVLPLVTEDAATLPNT